MLKEKNLCYPITCCDHFVSSFGQELPMLPLMFHIKCIRTYVPHSIHSTAVGTNNMEECEKQVWPVDAVLSFLHFRLLYTTKACMTLLQSLPTAFLWYPVRLYWYYKITVHLMPSLTHICCYFILMNLSHKSV